MSDKKRILIVDDEEDLRDILAFHLQKNGYETIDAPSGNQALQVLKKEAAENRVVDAIISDLTMNNGTGLELLNNLYNDKDLKKPFFIIYTGDESTVKSNPMYRAEAEVFSKPMNWQKLFELLKNKL